MIGYHTLNRLTEKVYSVNIMKDDEDIDYELTSFFNELMRRRRNDDIEEGLQAGGVIYSDRAGFKICERDGLASHAQAQENCSQFINGEEEFSSEEAVGMIGLRKKDPNAWANITKNGFSVRIVATENGLIFIFNSYNYSTSYFQLNTIYKLFNLIRDAYKDKKVDYVYINYVTSADRFVFDENKDIDEQLNKLETILLKRMEEKKEKTRAI